MKVGIGLKLAAILEGYEYELLRGSLQISILGIEQDSRMPMEGKMFVAVKGFTVDSHGLLNEAIKNGANCVVIERDVQIRVPKITVIRVKDTIDALARFSYIYFGKPSKQLNLIAITGTNGKTTTSYIIRNIFEKSYIKSGVIGTLGSVIDNNTIYIENTTPESLKIQKYLKDMVDAGAKYCIMEVSSHSLDLKRVEYLDFQIGIFMNLTEDHLDYHKTMEKYYSSKLMLFNRTQKCNIINGDDFYGRRILKESYNSIPAITYGLDKKWDVYATDIDYHIGGVYFTLNTPVGFVPISLKLLGKFNVYNSLAAASCCIVCGLDLSDIKVGLETINNIKGRFELIPTGRDFHVIIDFAHTPDGLKQVLSTIGQFVQGRIIVVFGAGGNRDKTKRPIMGEIAAKYADFTIITSDNPRFEDPNAIIRDIELGVKAANGNFVTITDRKEAIEFALSNARPKDVVLLAGKGHETHITIKNKTILFDERQIVLDVLKKLDK